MLGSILGTVVRVVTAPVSILEQAGGDILDLEDEDLPVTSFSNGIAEALEELDED